MMLGSLIYPFDQFTGQLVIAEAPKRAQELILMARHNKQFLTFLKKAVKQSDYVSFIVGHGSMVYLILAHYDLVPAGRLNLMGTTAQTEASSVATD